MPSATWKPRLRRGDAPVYVALVEALAADIGSGKLRSGDRLPTQRELSRAVGASLGTVTRAYAEAERRGLIRSQVGNGTFVRDLTDPSAYSPMLDSGRLELGPIAAPIVQGDVGHLALAASLQELGARADLAALSGYQSHGGTPAQREAGVRWLEGEGVPATVEEVTVTSGAQHATSLLLAALPTQAGLLVEELTYPGLLGAAQLLRIPMHPVAMDEDGLVPEALERAARESGARVLYCNPTHHNPTTTVTSRARRELLVAVCRAQGLTVIENGALAPLVPDAPPPLAALAPERTFHISSLSKATVPALRTGFIRSPAAHQPAIETAAAATLWSTSPLLAEVARQWIADGTARTVRDARRTEAAARQALAARALEGFRYRAHATASFLWLALPEERRALELVEQGLARHLTLGPAHLFTPRPGSAPNALRVSLTAARSRDELSRGLALLTELLRSPVRPLVPVL
ncbi:PLP-dependent aminotransferase family protein [Aggregicoccus sp. 17bor-14]|uniref:aminotransferase-like domain-containing protein n=1 Tax=Myxococcaceae TaxID=31 RepID=UPI00129C79BA|nr:MULTISPECIES: PLP-dependent aminotransferase family protein [Myxococcaceae]MBF5041527.1 PLP-dependent aminotransferase family protein [Simulacricoccus sp. 17bor-14]MRI87312.1 PLP-dependent aminotransferase family protein [Aggregicoccus sp. 17bor-14]